MMVMKVLKGNSPLHIIVFDEIDAICKKRGSEHGMSGVNDTVVNQLLSKIDGQHNAADIHTKHVDKQTLIRLLPFLHVHPEDGRPSAAPQLTQ